ncbi:hypothetical protein [Actinokineospora diospyrosa]|uniref:Subtilisin inhibitor-like n=1 Tax=Actinokineospora diospyrosa TaxID=103728 RepID=A0ABT1IJ64_9PSEU|nr:hypothetical protein [Actinokineospora diospyrosa]MCP2272694.1 hypothetical protein [Actinokineospora diospyrosa]
MTRERELLDRAVGVQPPLTLDFDAIEAIGKRAVQRRSRLMATGAVVAISAIALGGAVLMTRPSVPEVTPGSAPVTVEPTTREIAYCYRTADLTSTAPYHHIPVGVSNGDAAGAINEICAAIWTEDQYQWSSRGPGASPPPLVSCVLTTTAVEPQAGAVESGAVAVFPGDIHTCSSLGLPVAKL